MPATLPQLEQELSGLWDLLRMERDDNKRLRALLELAYDGLLNHHLHDIQERDDYTNRVGAGLTDEQRRRVMFGDEQAVREKK